MSAKKASRVTRRERNAPCTSNSMKASGEVVRQKRVSSPSTWIPTKGYRKGKAPATFLTGRSSWMRRISVSDACLQLRPAGLPLDAVGQSDQRAVLAILLDPGGRSVLGQPPPEIAGFADVDQRTGGVVQTIDAGRGRNPGEEVGAELPVEDPHAPLSHPGRDTS
jgi:hypothetical protein